MRPLLFCLLLIVVGCSDTTVLIVESDTLWTGSISGQGSSTHIEGTGNHAFTWHSGDQCWLLTRIGGTGFVRAYVKKGGRRLAETETTAAIATITACL